MLRDENAALIEPRRGKREPLLPEKALLVFTPQDCEVFLRLFSPPAERSHKVCLAQVHVGAYGGTPISVVGPAIGAPQAVMVVEKLIALGVREILAVGWCGSLQQIAAIGDVVIPLNTVCEEGTSVHYPIGAPPPGPSSELLSPLREALRSDQFKIHEGTVWTTDAPYRETFAKVSAYQRKGVLAVDMETSALFTLARYRGIRVAILLVVSDDLSSLKWIHGFGQSAFKQCRERLAPLALATMCRRA
jgi:uridine phosphorylase